MTEERDSNPGARETARPAGAFRRLEVGDRRHGLHDSAIPVTTEALPMTARRTRVAALFIAAIVLAACATEPSARGYPERAGRR